MQFKALSIVFPYGEKIASGEKTIEVRSWQPPTVPLKDVVIVQNHRLLVKDGEEDIEGSALAIVDFVAVKPWTEAEVQKACVKNFVAGYYGWHIENVRPLTRAQKAVAKRKIYQIELVET